MGPGFSGKCTEAHVGRLKSWKKGTVQSCESPWRSNMAKECNGNLSLFSISGADRPSPLPFESWGKAPQDPDPTMEGHARISSC